MLRKKYLRYLKAAKIRYSKKFTEQLSGIVNNLTGTATTKTFTGGLVAATGTLTLGANAGNSKTVTIGSKVYTFKTALTEVTEVLATATLTCTLNFVVDETVVIGSTTYTFKAEPDQSGLQVDVGVDLATSLASLTAAITAEQADIVTAINDDTTLTITALAGSGSGGNAIAATTTASNATWDTSGTLEGGVSYVAPVVNEILIGVAATNSIDNLVAAINNAAGEGTTYSTGTVAHTLVSAAAGTGDTMDVTALAVGEAGNTIVTSTNIVDASFAAATLEGGVSTNVLTSNAHGFLASTGPYRLTTTGTLPGGLQLATDYWIIAKDTNTFTLSTELTLNAAIVTNNGTGTHSIARSVNQAAIIDSLRRNNAGVVSAATDIDEI